MARIRLEDNRIIEITLYEESAPNTVRNFCSLALKGFYNGLKIYRIVKNFVIQMGCPNNNGKGTAGYCVPGEFKANGWDNHLTFERGTVGLGRVKDFNSGSSQFFITVSGQSSLDGFYAAFGRVTEGMDIVDEIASMETDGNQHAVTPITIYEVLLDEKEWKYAELPVIKLPDREY